MTRVKVCGITNAADALLAAEAGADALGLVFAASPRRVSPQAAAQIVARLPPLLTVVGVFCDQPVEEVAAIAAGVPLGAVQLHGVEPADACRRLPCKVIKRFNVFENDTADALRRRMEGYRVSAYLLDPGAGSGRSFDWKIARGLPGPLIVSGGLHAGNVGEVIRLLRPYAVDVSSGVEAAPGRKDRAKVVAFVQAVREADGSVGNG